MMAESLQTANVLSRHVTDIDEQLQSGIAQQSKRVAKVRDFIASRCVVGPVGCYGPQRSETSEPFPFGGANEGFHEHNAAGRRISCGLSSFGLH